MIKTRLRFIYLTLISLIITGCAGLPQQQAYNHQANQHIKKIAVVKPLKPEEVRIFYFNHPGMQMGLVGALVAEAEFSNKTTEYNTVITPKAFDPVDYLVKKLETELEGKNFEIVTISTNAKEPGLFMERYPNQDVDAFLDSYFHHYGYFAGSPQAVYKPTIGLQVRLVEKKSEALLYANHLMTGESFAALENSRYIGHTDKYSFPTFEDLLAVPDLTLEGLQDALDRLAVSLASELKGAPQALATTN